MMPAHVMEYFSRDQVVSMLETTFLKLYHPKFKLDEYYSSAKSCEAKIFVKVVL